MDKHGPIYDAVINDDLAEFMRLVELTPNFRFDRCVDIAITYDHASIMRYLIELAAEPSPHYRINIHGCVRSASYLGRRATVQLLIKFGADIRRWDDYCVRWASTGGYLSIVQNLVNHGADIHANNNECLHGAAKGGHGAVVRYLVSVGAVIRANCTQTLSAFGRTDIVRYLVTAGACEPIGKYARWPADDAGAKRGRAARCAYLWWVPRCYDRGRRAGRRMGRRNFAAYARMLV